jgi:hypothetical protein
MSLQLPPGSAVSIARASPYPDRQTNTRNATSYSQLGRTNRATDPREQMRIPRMRVDQMTLARGEREQMEREQEREEIEQVEREQEELRRVERLLLTSIQYRQDHNLGSQSSHSGDAMVVEFDVDAAQRAIQRRLQQNREHSLPRYYKLVEDITPDLWRWSITLYESAIDNSKHILSEESLKRMPTPEVFRGIGSNLLSKDSERALAAARIFEDFVGMWGEFCSGESLRDIMQDVSEIANMKEFFELLQEEGMKEEKLAWYWCLLYRTRYAVDLGT